ncbi:MULTISPECIES: DUF2630 family protein [Streptomyces]|uniref:DUF2630 family protein n=1 Tax=Streptomyces lasiicapitis TaxID=1923961 RepID=A0ABQ2LNU9_9ACTN|nr:MULTISPECIES: DUF2630 family protein [Streptomyces]QIB47319.1 DUF2630 family protein [Streptomyces aureoverticillatus]GGO41031.1 hypothetical protein GCM10012286_20130 [Streptomyces lasiicapitis]
MDQQQILARISEMVDAEKTLRESLASGAIDEATERARLGVLERELDQCWDLLRRRRAKAEFGGDPDTVSVRPSAQVEGYQS